MPKLARLDDNDDDDDDDDDEWRVGGRGGWILFLL